MAGGFGSASLDALWAWLDATFAHPSDNLKSAALMAALMLAIMLPVRLRFYGYAPLLIFYRASLRKYTGYAGMQK